MALFRFADLDPVSGILTLQRELERALQNPFGLDLGPSGRGVFPPVNVFSTPDGYVVKMEVPGIAPDAISIESHGRTLTVTGQREHQAPEGGSFHRRERDTGRFSRSLQLPADLDLDHIEATCGRGVLTIRVPKRAEAKPRQISVNAA